MSTIDELLSGVVTLGGAAEEAIVSLRSGYELGRVGTVRIAVIDLYSYISKVPDIRPSDADIPEWKAVDASNSKLDEEIYPSLVAADRNTPTVLRSADSASERETQLIELSCALARVVVLINYVNQHVVNPSVSRQDALWVVLFQFWTGWAEDMLLALRGLHTLEIPTAAR